MRNSLRSSARLLATRYRLQRDGECVGRGRPNQSFTLLCGAFVQRAGVCAPVFVFAHAALLALTSTLPHKPVTLLVCVRSCVPNARAPRMHCRRLCGAGVNVTCYGYGYFFGEGGVYGTSVCAERSATQTSCNLQQRGHACGTAMDTRKTRIDNCRAAPEQWHTQWLKRCLFSDVPPAELRRFSAIVVTMYRTTVVFSSRLFVA